MAKDLFANLDLNLLRTFIILYQEKNMRKASDRLFVSQPAVSKALQRLRDHFGDELFVKTHHGLRETERASQLAESIGPLLDELSIAVNHSTKFEPSQLNGVIKIAISPFFLTGIASKFLTIMRKEAPNTQIHLLNWSKTTLQELINGDIHMGLNYNISHSPKEIIKKHMVTDQFKAYVRNDHPYSKNEIEIENGIDFEIATLIAADWNSNLSHTEKLLKIKGLESNVVFRSELPSSITDVVKNSDILFPGSRYLNLDSNPGLRPIKILFDNVEVDFDIHAYLHNKNRNSATTQWLHKKLLEALKD